MKTLPTSCLVLCVAVAALSAAAADPHVVGTFKIGGDDSNYDFLKVDPIARRLYVAHERTFEVLNVDTGEKIGQIGPTGRAHGVAVAREAGHGFASSGIDHLITMFDLKTLATIRKIKSTGHGPDAIEYDPQSNRVYAANHGTGQVTVLDPVSGDILADILVAGDTLECMGFDGRGQGFVNDEGPAVVHVFDTHTLKPKATWALAPGEGPTGLAVDAAHHRIFSACANKMVVVLDSDSGKIITIVPSGEDCDGAAYDAKRGLIYVPHPDGTVTVIKQETADKYSVLTTIKTEPGVKTIGFDEKTGRVFTATGKFGPTPAPVKSGLQPKTPLIPGSFEIIVIGP